jgi:hypothetical protein
MVGAVTAFTLTSGVGLGIDPRGDPDLGTVPEIIVETGLAKGYGISVDSEIRIILNSKEEAQEVLKELEAHYINIATDKARSISQGYTAISATFEEEIAIVGIEKDQDEDVDEDDRENEAEDEVMEKKEALQALIDGNIITVIVEGKYEVVEEIVFQTETVKDPALGLDTTRVKQEGVNGSKTSVYSFITKNDDLVENKMSEENIKEPVNKIILEGPMLYTGNFSGAYIIRNQQSNKLLVVNAFRTWDEAGGRDADYIAAVEPMGPGDSWAPFASICVDSMRGKDGGYWQKFSFTGSGGTFQLRSYVTKEKYYYVAISSGYAQAVLNSTQKWCLYDMGDGSFIICSSNNTSQVLASTSDRDYTNVVVQAYSPTNAYQKWKLEKVTTPP